MTIKGLIITTFLVVLVYGLEARDLFTLEEKCEAQGFNSQACRDLEALCKKNVPEACYRIAMRNFLFDNPKSILMARVQIKKACQFNYPHACEMWNHEQKNITNDAVESQKTELLAKKNKTNSELKTIAEKCIAGEIMFCTFIEKECDTSKNEAACFAYALSADDSNKFSYDDVASFYRKSCVLGRDAACRLMNSAENMFNQKQQNEMDQELARQNRIIAQDRAETNKWNAITNTLNNTLSNQIRQQKEIQDQIARDRSLLEIQQMKTKINDQQNKIDALNGGRSYR